MPRKVKAKKEHRTKISQKVIQKVIVKIGEDRKARKVRRRQRRNYKKEYEQELQQQGQSIPATVVYNTGGAYQPLQFGQSIITPQPIMKNAKIAELETPVGIANIQTKKQQLEEFITPVPAQDDIQSRIYSEPVYRTREKVEGNYSFGMPDLYSEKPPTSLYDNESQLIKPSGNVMSLSEYLLSQQAAQDAKGMFEENPRSRPKSVAEAQASVALGMEELQAEKKPKRTNRSRREIASDRYAELKALYEQTGLSTDEASRIANDVKASELFNEIKRTKKEIKARKKKPK